MTDTIEAPAVETIECSRGVITFTMTAEGWRVEGVHKTHTANGKPVTFTYTVARCDCRERAQADYDERMQQGGLVASLARRPKLLCNKGPLGHPGDNRPHRNEFDHCESNGHDAKVRAIVSELAKTYGRAQKLGPLATLDRIAPQRPVRAGEHERREYLEWLAETDPSATNPYARP
jgi:hypothetical protein